MMDYDPNPFAGSWKGVKHEDRCINCNGGIGTKRCMSCLNKRIDALRAAGAFGRPNA